MKTFIIFSLVACLLSACIIVKPDVAGKSVKVIHPAFTNAAGEVFLAETNSIQVETISWIASLGCAVLGHPELSGTAGFLLAGGLGIWAWWVRRKAKK